MSHKVPCHYSKPTILNVWTIFLTAFTVFPIHDRSGLIKYEESYVSGEIP